MRSGSMDLDDLKRRVWARLNRLIERKIITEDEAILMYLRALRAGEEK